MKLFGKLFYFFGSVYFAIILIASLAFFVIAGTFIESATDSHRHAALFTYHHPLFIALLWGFFLNILLSSLRRWPFKLRHVPFLITHCGLLMILGGILIKSKYGLQGTMSLMEGSEERNVFIDSPSLRIDAQGNGNPVYYDFTNGKILTEDGLTISLVEYAPNSYERVQTWIKGDQGHITGLKPFPVYDWTEGIPQEDLPLSTRIKTLHPLSPPWDVLACRVSDVRVLAEKAYRQGIKISIKDTATQEELFASPLAKILDQPVQTPYGKITATLDFNVDTTSSLNVTLNTIQVNIPLDGQDALINSNVLTPHLGKAALTADLTRKPLLLFVQDDHDDTYLFAFGPSGQVHSEAFCQDKLKCFLAYDGGFRGYSVQAHLPLDVLCGSRPEREQALLDGLIASFRSTSQEASSFIPPLRLLCQACEKCNLDFPETLGEYLRDWDNSGSWLYPIGEDKMLSSLEWQSIPKQDLKACLWLHTLFSQLEHRLKKGESVLSVLREQGWPLLSDLEAIEGQSAQLTAFAQQVFSISEQLPDIDEEAVSSDLQGRLLSAYLRAYNVDLQSLLLLVPKSEKEGSFLETPLAWRQYSDIPSSKLEDNLPKAAFKIQKGNKTDFATLTYDRYAQSLRRPILDGEYLIRFQPHFVALPYSIRLRQARQINYANSGQPYSFESDLLITDTLTNEAREKTISMNNVHETWEGYRFYLANITPQSEGSVKRIQLVINYDPAKYWLTYPGAVILSLGVILLFWFRNRK